MIKLRCYPCDDLNFPHMGMWLFRFPCSHICVATNVASKENPTRHYCSNSCSLTKQNANSLCRLYFKLGCKTAFPGRRWTGLRGWIWTRRRLASRGLPLRCRPWGWRRRFRQGHNWGEVDHWRVEKERWSPPTRILRSAKILADKCTSDRAWTTTRWQHGQCTRGVVKIVGLGVLRAF